MRNGTTFLQYFVSAMLVIVGIIHLLPLSGALGGARLAALYGISFDEPNPLILMRHRAVLFGMLGAFMIVAAFKPTFQLSAFVAGFVSVVSFLWIAYSTDGYNAAIARVVAVDFAALLCLLVGAAGFAYLRNHN
jgi:hypothetical protein